jgi:uncharacterized protein YjbI with pentapeptide repeats
MTVRRQVTRLDMAGKTFQGLHAANVLLDQCDFSGTTFVGCHFNDLVVRGSNLESARFEQCSMNDLTLTSCQARGVRVEGGTIDGLRCHESDLAEVSLDGVTIQQCTFLCTRMDDVRVAACRIGHATFTEIEARQMRFEEGSLLDAIWFDCTLAKASFHALNIERQVMGRTALEDCTWSNVHGKSVTWFDCRARGLAFKDSPMRQLSFHQSRIEHSDLRCLSLDEGVLGQAQLIGCDLTHANLERVFADGARLEGCSLLAVRANGSSWLRAHFISCVVDGSDFSNADLREASLVDIADAPACAEGARIQGASANGKPIDTGAAPWHASADDPLWEARQEWRKRRLHAPCPSNPQRRS